MKYKYILPYFRANYFRQNEFFNFPCSFTAKFRNVLPESQILLKHNSQNYIPNYENQWLFSLIIISYYFLNYFKHEHFMLNFYTSVKKGEGLLHARISSKKYVGGICHNATCKSLSLWEYASMQAGSMQDLNIFGGSLLYPNNNMLLSKCPCFHHYFAFSFLRSQNYL
jgi:hypothetical protein